MTFNNNNNYYNICVLININRLVVVLRFMRRGQTGILELFMCLRFTGFNWYIFLIRSESRGNRAHLNIYQHSRKHLRKLLLEKSYNIFKRTNTIYLYYNIAVFVPHSTYSVGFQRFLLFYTRFVGGSQSSLLTTTVTPISSPSHFQNTTKLNAIQLFCLHIQSMAIRTNDNTPDLYYKRLYRMW